MVHKDDSEIFTKVGFGPNLVLLHGWQQDKNTWVEICKYLKKDYTCWSVDLPSFGENYIALANFSPQGYATWVEIFFKKHGIKTASILGHSFGGRIAIALSVGNKSLNKLILYGVPSPASHGKSSLFKSLSRVSGIKNVPLISDLARSDDYKKTPEEKRAIFNKAIEYNYIADLNKISIPTLLLWGEKDDQTPIEIASIINKQIKNSHLEIIPRSSHFAHLEKPSLFAGKVIRFLNNDN